MRAPDYGRIFPHRSLRIRALWVFLTLAFLSLREVILQVQLQGVHFHAKDLTRDIDSYPTGSRRDAGHDLPQHPRVPP